MRTTSEERARPLQLQTLRWKVPVQQVIPCLLDGAFNDQRENEDEDDYDVSVRKSPSPPCLGYELSDSYIHPDPLGLNVFASELQETGKFHVNEWKPGTPCGYEMGWI